MGRNCTRDVEQLVEQLLQTRQGALEEQNNQMQQWQGDLENQCQLLQWEGALQINTVLLGNLWDNLKSVKDTAEKAYHQINNWMSTGTWPVAESDSNTKYVQIISSATVIFENAKVDLKGWCGTQHTTLNVLSNRLEQKVRTGGNDMEITTEDMLLKRITMKGVGGIEEMKRKFESIQSDLNKLPALSLHMGLETCEKGSLKDWEEGFTEHVATVLDLTERCSLLVAHVSKDLTQMRDVKDRLAAGNAIKDVTLLQTKVLPQLKQLLNLLDKHREPVDSI
jgi:hypothetical protein